MGQRRFAAAAVAAAVLLVPIGAGCSDDDDEAVLETSSADDGGDQPTTTAGGATGAGDAGTDETTEDPGSDTDNGGGDVPDDQALDTSVRTPGGVTLNITRVSFDGDDILVDAEFKNGQADYEIYLWQGYPTSDLRIVDDAGQDYNFIEPDDASSPLATDQLVLQPGESLSGTFAFRGPLAGEPDTISLVTNVDTASIPSYRLEDQTEGYYPGFVVPVDLTWA